MTVPWFIHAISRLLGVNVYGTSAFYIPYFYGMSDQIGATVAGFVVFRRRGPSLSVALRAYLTHPVMIAGLLVVLLVPIGLLTARTLGFSPDTQLRAAAETVAANPLLGSSPCRLDA